MSDKIKMLLTVHKVLCFDGFSMVLAKKVESIRTKCAIYNSMNRYFSFHLCLFPLCSCSPPSLPRFLPLSLARSCGVLKIRIICFSLMDNVPILKH